MRTSEDPYGLAAPVLPTKGPRWQRSSTPSPPARSRRSARTGRRVNLPQGWSPIWENTPADKAYILLDGTVSVRRDGAEIAVLGPGDIVGEAAIVGHSLRTASIVATSPLQAIHFTDERRPRP